MKKKLKKANKRIKELEIIILVLKEDIELLIRQRK
jgi:hypothetical protein